MEREREREKERERGRERERKAGEVVWNIIRSFERDRRVKGKGDKGKEYNLMKKEGVFFFSISSAKRTINRKLKSDGKKKKNEDTLNMFR